LDREAVLQALQRFIDEGGGDPAVLEQVLAGAAQDPELVSEITAMLEQAGAASGPAPPLDIEALYPGGEGLYTLRWPLVGPSPLPVPFEDLDRKTQFFVLVNQWSYRDFQGWSALDSGALDAAEAIFVECAERARQLAVGELEARSYEGMQAVADKRGRPDDALVWSTKAGAARAAR
jgi:hypothetical protein